MISATIFADSRNQSWNRITTFRLEYPRWIHAEIMTHRVFSRNAASSRAIPIERMIQSVLVNPAEPVEWGTNKPGMQAGAPLGREETIVARAAWQRAAQAAADHARTLLALGVHKQIANRLLEPFAHMTTLVTATEWDNFFSLRAHPDAQPEFQELAYTMLDAYLSSGPADLAPGEWHIPFGDMMPDGLTDEDRLKIATARCARTSYLTFDGQIVVEKDIPLHDRLASAGHWSPFEHSACALESDTWSGNFRGFRQYRKQFAGENRRADLHQIAASRQRRTSHAA
ncbi:MAG: FAD-dependent thymidylate synthase [Gemmatimonadaceae bacterium]